MSRTYKEEVGKPFSQDSWPMTIPELRLKDSEFKTTLYYSTGPVLKKRKEKTKNENKT